MKRFLSISFLAVALPLGLVHVASGQIVLTPQGPADAIYGTGVITDIDVGDYVLFQNAGSDPIGGIDFDLVLRVNELGTNSSLRADNTEFFRVFGTITNSAVWADVSLFLALAGSTSVSNPSGTRLNFVMDQFVAGDIDSHDGDPTQLDISDVFGLYSPPGSPVLGSALVAAGFLGDDGQPNIPYVRAREDNPLGPGVPDFTNVPNSDPPNPDYDATWTYPADFVTNELRLVWGFTSATVTTNTLNRGLTSTITLGELSVIPEPSSALLLMMGALVASLHRRRP